MLIVHMHIHITYIHNIPLYTLQFRIVNSFMADMPFGQVGELVIGGPQVANGYTREDPRSAFFHSNDGKKVCAVENATIHS